MWYIGYISNGALVIGLLIIVSLFFVPDAKRTWALFARRCAYAGLLLVAGSIVDFALPILLGVHERGTGISLSFGPIWTLLGGLFFLSIWFAVRKA